MNRIELTPRDLLFFGDGRPLGGSNIGDGADWPLPSTLHSAVRSALHDRWPERNPEREPEHRHLSKKEQKKQRRLRAALGRKSGTVGSFRFGSLKTIGPFPAREGALYVPTPADVRADGIMQPCKLPGTTNLPTPLTMAVVDTTPPSKERVGPWTPLSEITRYLDGQGPPKTVAADVLYLAESRPGVGIDPLTHANQAHRFYQARYLRPRPDVKAHAWIEARTTAGRRGECTDVVETLLTEAGTWRFVLGGQAGVVSATAVPHDADDDVTALPLPSKLGTQVKWVLLSPTVFSRGWLPDWIDPKTGRVLLRAVAADERGNMSRREWRQRLHQADFINARLVAARVPNPLPVSGWMLDPDADRAGGVPKPTRLLVRAGSVYYFTCETVEHAHILATQLHGKTKTPQLGEQGFGFGVCGSWTPFALTSTVD